MKKNVITRFIHREMAAGTGNGTTLPYVILLLLLAGTLTYLVNGPLDYLLARYPPTLYWALVRLATYLWATLALCVTFALLARSWKPRPEQYPSPAGFHQAKALRLVFFALPLLIGALCLGITLLVCGCILVDYLLGTGSAVVPFWLLEQPLLSLMLPACAGSVQTYRVALKAPAGEP
ncbi:hypothetical protein V9K67_21775 [Paraflavisolibacter sp. H34]|uniref:hypothetical protein n=1 Tax=Huijunlia imazamoxiresistens TaxID=3127457 RepID=UPI003018D4E2